MKKGMEKQTPLGKVWSETRLLQSLNPQEGLGGKR